MINIFQPSLGELELAAVRQVFTSNWLGRGAQVAEFEQAFAHHLGVGPHLLTSTNSCTEATFLAMELADIGPGTEVVLPTISFVGAANAVAARGARPVFCDVDPRTLNPSVTDVDAALTPRTKAVLLLHYGGYPGDVAQIAALCRDRGILLVEDTACSVASSVDGRACGTFGDMGMWSFDAGKILVTVDGGMLYTRTPALAERAAKLTYFGLEQVSGFAQAQQTDVRWWEFEVSSFSRRSITNDVLAAVGTVQLGRLGEFVRRRRDVAERYDRGLADVAGLACPPPLPEGHQTSYYLYWVQLDESIRDGVARDLYRRDIYTTFRYPPLHRVRAYGSEASLPKAELAAARTLCLPLHQALSDADIDLTITALREAVAARLGERQGTGRPWQAEPSQRA